MQRPGAMQSHFNALTDALDGWRQPGEDFTVWFDGEDSDFVRFNKGRVRQPGTVWQRTLSLRWIAGRRHASVELDLTGDLDADRGRLQTALGDLRERLPHLPEDPHLLWCQDGEDVQLVAPSALPSAADAVGQIVESAGDADLVGIYAAGSQAVGLATSRGQRCWDEAHTFNFDWCLYARGDKAVKSTYAGETWSPDELAARMSRARAQLDVLGRPVKTLSPGSYRAYLSPAAVAEIFDLFRRGGFSLKSTRTRVTPLLRMHTEGLRFDPRVRLWEDTVGAPAPAFQSDGFRKPDRVPLITDGALDELLVNPRSAQEYGVPTNGAMSWEGPEALSMAGGTLDEADVISRLGTGLYISNLWYLNFSDCTAGRFTGMTRFATCWVEDGEVVAPLGVMRFDETIFRLFGEALEDLTRVPELQLSSSTYFRRSMDSSQVPGALVREMAFTL